jgi:peptidoglycan/LPS O-acetylase OafA/YrhL
MLALNTTNSTSRLTICCQGLRGIASILIVVSHLSLAWDPALFAPRDDEDVASRFLQWPILRVPWQGRFGVPIFAFLTGYVLSLKPIKQSRAGDPLAAFTSLARSAFRRPARFILPATIALIFSWVMTQFGAFTVASRSDSLWLRETAPILEGSIWSEFLRLLANFLSTWTTGTMEYDDQQWALLPLLEASILVYVLLCSTMFVKVRWRMAIYLIMFLYFHQDAAKGIGLFPSESTHFIIFTN